MKRRRFDLSSEGVQIDAPSRHIRKIPHAVVSNGGIAIATIWEIGYMRMFVHPGIKKPKSKSAEYLGEARVREGMYEIDLVKPSLVPTHKPETTRLRHANWHDLLAVAYFMRKGSV
jgi:hypothetical protein